jgi:hypothetical protein
MKVKEYFTEVEKLYTERMRETPIDRNTVVLMAIHVELMRIRKLMDKES